MKTKVDDIEDSFYAIYSDLTFKEVRSLEEAFNMRPYPIFVVKKVYKGKTKSFYNDDYFNHFYYSFYNNELREHNWNESGWTIVDIDEPINCRTSVVWYKISDPNGEIKSISNHQLDKIHLNNYFGIKGICNLISYLRNLAKYPNWTCFGIVTENLKLIAENEKLKIKIKELESKTTDA
ncbi:hypothetical protein LBMAG27_23620 [Bacteroidota bacterium]|nr:hypothetical protein LBMAG27_23620 [Bacteroidota bacterium]